MTPRIPQSKSHLLLVEGKVDKEFFIQLGYQLRFDDNTPIHIEKYCGKDNLGNFLRGLLTHPRFSQLKNVGIVRDADTGGGAFQSVRDTIVSVNSGRLRQMGVPKQVLELSDGTPATIVLILPSAERHGMIEDLIMDLFKDDSVSTCVDSYFECLRADDQTIPIAIPSKARLRTFITGKNVGSNAGGNDAGRSYLSDVFRMSWWKPEFWDHPAFNDAKDFLTQLLAD